MAIDPSSPDVLAIKRMSIFDQLDIRLREFLSSYNYGARTEDVFVFLIRNGGDVDRTINEIKTKSIILIRSQGREYLGTEQNYELSHRSRKGTLAMNKWLESWTETGGKSALRMKASRT